MSKPTEPYDPQTLDHYESFHKEIDRNGYLHIAGYAAVFAPFGWFIGMNKLNLAYWQLMVKIKEFVFLQCSLVLVQEPTVVTAQPLHLRERDWRKDVGLSITVELLISVCSSSIQCNFSTTCLLTVNESLLLMSEEQNHAFENRWVLLEQCYIDNRADRSRGYDNSFDKLCVIDTVESFWKFWRGLPAITWGWRALFMNRDVFYDGCEKVVERTDSRAPDGAPRKCRVDP